MSDPSTVSRRLVAVFAADVEGYSRRMGADEVGTLKGLTERRAILSAAIGSTALPRLIQTSRHPTGSLQNAALKLLLQQLASRFKTERVASSR